MNVLIDMQSMKFLHKAEDATALLLLAEIELPHVPVRCEPCDCHDFLKSRTDMEMFLLYKNSVGEHPKHLGDRLRAVMIELVSRMPELKLNRHDLQLQVNNIPKDDKRQYKYIPTAQYAQCPDDLFDVPAIAATASPHEQTAAAHGPRHMAQELYPGVDHDAAYLRAVSQMPKLTTNAPTPVAQAELFDIMDCIMDEAGRPNDPVALQKVMADIISALMESFNMGEKRAYNEFILWAQARATLA